MKLDHYDLLTKQAEEAFVHGQLEQACTLLEQAETEATTQRDTERADQAFCRRCYINIEFEESCPDRDLLRLKEILMRSRDPKTRVMAAYYAGMAFHIQGEHDKAKSYGTRAISIAEECGDTKSIASCSVLLGNIALLASDFIDAEAAYRRSLEPSADLSTIHELVQAQALDDLGYVLICTDRISEGIELCEQAAEITSRLDANHFMHQILQDLCYGYILVDRLGEARDCGEQGLELALEMDDRLVAKNLHFLLAEVSIRSGDRFGARRFLNRLAEYYPEIPESEDIVDVLMGMDFTEVVNLRG